MSLLAAGEAAAATVTATAAALATITATTTRSARASPVEAQSLAHHLHLSVQGDSSVSRLVGLKLHEATALKVSVLLDPTDVLDGAHVCKGRPDGILVNVVVAVTHEDSVGGTLVLDGLGARVTTGLTRRSSAIAGSGVLGLGKVHPNLTTVNVTAVQRSNGSPGRVSGRVANKGGTVKAVRLAVLDKVHAGNFAVGGEQVGQRLLVHAEGEVTNVQLRRFFVAAHGDALCRRGNGRLLHFLLALVVAAATRRRRRRRGGGGGGRRGRGGGRRGRRGGRRG
mmetsp:Transcript_2283/g.7209  ORF Transcript_2283/g.7209 Transcript_2283/m.7209 type:complete len:281 (+) Transcript_2283:205-1047(+)